MILYVTLPRALKLERLISENDFLQEALESTDRVTTYEIILDSEESLKELKRILTANRINFNIYQ